MTEKEIAIGLYRENLTREQIRRKMDITCAELNEYLADEPVRPRNYPETRKAAVYRPSKARLRGEALLRKGMPVDEVQKILNQEGMTAAKSTICRWRVALKGPINRRIPAADYPMLKDLILANPSVSGTGIAMMYHGATGRRLDRRAASYWCRKVRRAA
jgi:hypothetical protein